MGFLLEKLMVPTKELLLEIYLEIVMVTLWVKIVWEMPTEIQMIDSMENLLMKQIGTPEIVMEVGLGSWLVKQSATLLVTL